LSAFVLSQPTDHDQLREIGLSAKQAETVLQWISRRNGDEVNALTVDRISRFFTHLLLSTTTHKINFSLLGVRALAGLFLMNRTGSTMTLPNKRERPTPHYLFG
jgi:hypothetical protein